MQILRVHVFADGRWLARHAERDHAAAFLGVLDASLRRIDPDADAERRAVAATFHADSGDRALRVERDCRHGRDLVGYYRAVVLLPPRRDLLGLEAKLAPHLNPSGLWLSQARSVAEQALRDGAILKVSELWLHPPFLSVGDLRVVRPDFRGWTLL